MERKKRTWKTIGCRVLAVLVALSLVPQVAVFADTETEAPTTESQVVVSPEPAVDPPAEKEDTVMPPVVPGEDNKDDTVITPIVPDDDKDDTVTTPVVPDDGDDKDDTVTTPVVPGDGDDKDDTVTTPVVPGDGDDKDETVTTPVVPGDGDDKDDTVTTPVVPDDGDDKDNTVTTPAVPGEGDDAVTMPAIPDMGATTLPNKVPAAPSYQQHGGFTFTIPAELHGEYPDTTYTAKIYLYRTNFAWSMENDVSLDGSENYSVKIAGKDARAFQMSAVWSEEMGKSTLQGTLDRLVAGDVITIPDVLLYDKNPATSWKNFDKTYIVLELTSSNNQVVETDTEITTTTEVVTVTQTEGDATLLVADTTTPLAVTIQSEITTDIVEKEPKQEQRLTDETLTYSGNPLIYLLSNYNVISYKDIESTHIVGPIIAQDYAYRTAEGNGIAGDSEGSTDGGDESHLFASDYSRGISSYVGLIRPVGSSPESSTFQLRYGFENMVPHPDNPDISMATDFIAPSFYTRATDKDGNMIKLYEMLNATNERIDTVELPDGSILTSPNNEGRIDNYDALGRPQEEETITFQNDAYINFPNLWDAINNASVDLLAEGTLEGPTDVIVYDQAPAKLTIQSGESYLIKDASLLETIDLILPEGYDFFTNPYLDPTTVSFLDDSINPTTVGGKFTSRFPEILINGKQMPAYQGHNGEYSEVGNRIIWNMPNIVTNGENNRLIYGSNGPNVPGHIVAPNAELWNYYEEGGSLHWGGGNLNGTAIVKDFHGGVMEMHMWAYGGRAEQSTVLNLTAEKTFEKGNLADTHFTFLLDDVDGGNYAGLVNPPTFPVEVTCDAEGNIYFPSLTFNQAGTYLFTVSEKIPETPAGDITYDQSVYQVSVVVTTEMTEIGTVEYVNFYHICSITKIKDKDGTATDTAVDNITFVNEKTGVPDKASYTFTKVDEMGYPLSGAVFILTPDAVDGIPNWDSENLRTFANGHEVVPGEVGTLSNAARFTFTDLELNTTYYFKESEAPAGYLPQEGYWKLEVNDVGSVFITAMDGANEIVDHTIENLPEEEELEDVVLTKVSEGGRPLSGAVFHIHRVLSLDNPISVEGGFCGEATSDANGKIRIEGILKNGVYRLTEEKAPDGYQLPHYIDYWLLEIETDDDGTMASRLYTVKNDIPVLQDTLELVNMSAYILPATGGTGTLPYIVLGLLILATPWILFRKKKTTAQ